MIETIKDRLRALVRAGTLDGWTTHPPDDGRTRLWALNQAGSCTPYMGTHDVLDLLDRLETR